MKDLRLGLVTNLGEGGLARFTAAALLADDLGYHALWTGEAYGFDAVTPLGYAAAFTKRVLLGTAILQMPARTPAMTAMTAATLDAVSGGRALLGLGLSGPQVVEGWHGRPYTPPLTTTREYVEIVRRALAREEPLTYDGVVHRLPLRDEGATGLGKPLKLMCRPRADIPIYLAAIGPKTIAQAARIADGFLPHIWSPDRWKDAFGDVLAGVDFDRFDVAPTVFVASGEDVDRCRDAVRPLLALYIGGMGSRGKNFYNDLVRRYGYEAAATEVQDLFLDGKRREATAAVPDDLVDDVALVGPPERIRDRLDAWRETPAKTLNVAHASDDDIRLMAELVS